MALRRDFLFDLLPDNSTGAEIGVWEGAFSERLLASGKVGQLYLIDPWAFDPTIGNEIWGGGLVSVKHQIDMDLIYEAVVEKFMLDMRVWIYREYSQVAVGRFDDESLDWVYLDGDHRYEHISRDIAAWTPKVKKGGLVIGDDYHTSWPGVPKAFNELDMKKFEKLVNGRECQIVLRKL